MQSIIHRGMAQAIPFIPRALLQRVSRRYVAGETLADAVACVRRLAEAGCMATVDVLGEVTHSLAQATQAADEYIALLDALHHAARRDDGHAARRDDDSAARRDDHHAARRVGDHAPRRVEHPAARRAGQPAHVSLKPSAFGLLIDPAHCEAQIERVLQAAARHGSFVRLDMEDLRCTQAEIDLLVRLRQRHANVGLVLQAYLRRTHDDIAALARPGENLRICKGIYAEDPAQLVPHAVRDRRAINPHFVQHVRRCFEAGCFVGIATHDEALVDELIALAEAMAVDRTRFEFQMLLGVCEPLRDRLLREGFAVRIYVPYGRDWIGYGTRRIKENPAIAGQLLKGLLKR
jgi:proline dehydrogenase